jgi:hypothetical protein
VRLFKEAWVNADRGQAMKQRVIVIQSMRTDRFGDVTVLGSQYRDQNRVLHWVLAVLSERNTNVRIYRVSGGERFPPTSALPTKTL